ncbi:MAG: Uma2 family endonuclease, partial [Cyanobacteria bacterium P01_F01_bin.143]
RIANALKKLEELTKYESINENVCFLIIEIAIVIARTIEYKHKTNRVSQRGINIIEKAIKCLRLDNEKLINETIKRKGFENISRYVEAIIHINQNLSKFRNILKEREVKRNGFGKEIKNSRDFKKINNISQKLSELIQYALIINKDPNEDAIITIPNVTSDQYENFRETIGEASWCRISYSDGVLELMAPGIPHEKAARGFEIAITMHCLKNNIQCYTFGSADINLKGRNIKGKQPDASFSFGKNKDIPDLAIECNFTNGSIKDLNTLKKIGISEVWMYSRKEGVRIFSLSKKEYTEIYKSKLLPDLSIESLNKMIEISLTKSSNEVAKLAFSED